MIRWPAAATAAAPLTSAERFGLELLVDLARLVPMEDPEADVVAIEVVGDSDVVESPRSLAARDWGFEAVDGAVRIPRGTLGVVVEVAGSAAEQRSSARDRHDR